MSRFVFILVMLCALSALVPAQAREAWLVTYGIGPALEERFGHNALWMRDPAAGVDRIYNFGFFDFDQENFYTDYAFGEMTYFAAARPPQVEFDYYVSRNRSIRTQRLDLSDAQFDRLLRALEFHVAPANRDFRYDYYFNNCSNRIRDMLDLALGGALSAATRALPARLDFRAHTRRLLEATPVLYTLVQTGLGRPADRPRTAWEEMFLPDAVAREAGRLMVDDGAGGRRPLVTEDRMLFESAADRVPAMPGFARIRYLALGALTAGLVLGPVLLAGRRFAALLPFRTWLLMTFAAGGMLMFLWGFTDHYITRWNENLLLLNPLLLTLWRARPGPVAQVAAVLVGAGLALAVVLKFLPGAQWNLDLMLWLVPAQVAALAAWWWSGKG